MATYILPYRKGSKSVKQLKKSLGAKVLKLNNSKALPKNNNIIINWGNSNNYPVLSKGLVLNPPDILKQVTNKLNFFDKVCLNKEIVVPDWTTEKEKTIDWKTIVVREKLTGHSGEGITILNSQEEFDNYDHRKAKLYTKYIKKKYEYRVHVVGNKIIDIRRKGLRNDFPRDEVNWKVRNHSGGFIYLMDMGHVPNPCVEEQALKTIEQTGLDFGAVDIIYNELEEKAYVLEVNTAPGIVGSTVDNYTQAFKEIING